MDCIFPDLRDKSNDSSVADRLSIVTSGRIEPLPPLIFERCKHSKQSICLSQNDLLILLALFWCRINPSFLTESRVRPWRSPLCLHFWRRPGYNLKRVRLLYRARFNKNSSPISFGIRSETYRTRLENGPDLLSCSIKRNRVRVDIRVRLKNIELDYPETGKHPIIKQNLLERL